IPQQEGVAYMQEMLPVLKSLWAGDYAHDGHYWSFPTATAVPKPLQKPHPPIWVACSNRETIHLAAQLGIGALTFSFVDPAEAKKWVDDYYETIKTECVPIGHAVNANIAMVTSFSVHQDEQVAIDRGMDGFRFFQFALAHYYRNGVHTPGRTNIWEKFEAARDQIDEQGRLGGGGGIGTPDQLRKHLREFTEVGVDQLVFIQQGGNNRHEDICASLELFASDVMPEFKEREEERERAKAEELAPYIEQAMARKQRMQELKDEEIPQYPAYGFSIAEEGEAEAIPEAATAPSGD
ncbi:MAG: LLM class flavin-dependent oxidoreductase, partial [Dehalococcoidia bacterium]